MLATPNLTAYREVFMPPKSANPGDSGDTRLLRLRQAARRLDINHSYLRRLTERMKAEGVIVSEPAEGIVLFDEASLVKWWKSWHPGWVDPEQTS